MDDHSLAELGQDERKVLAVFVHHGRDGRAITTASLAVHAGFAADRQRLAAALRNLAARGLITEGGDDPFAGAPVAYRLTRPMPRRQPDAEAS
jgi:hypothetical protein